MMERRGEYVSNDFLIFCNSHGRHKKLIMWYTPQQNIVTERNNITIMEMTRIMIASKHFPNEYWDEVVATVVYIMNRCVTKSVEKKIHKEALTCMNHSVSHLIFFCCVVYAHAQDELRKKLDNKGDGCIFVGYSDDTKS